MKKPAHVLVITLLACVAAGLATYHVRTQQDPSEWLGRQLGLEGERLAEFTAAHNEYAIACAEMCRRINAANSELAELVINEREVTPGIVEALSRTEALRAECKQNMLAHFMNVAGMLDKEKQGAYMKLVLPLIAERDYMEKSHEHRHP